MKSIHPIELAIVAVIGLCEGLWWLFRTVLVPTIVIVAVLAGYSPTRGVEPVTTPIVATPPETSQTAHTAPFMHPLALVGDELRQLTNRELMGLVGTRKKLTKAQLIGSLVAT